MHTGSARGGGTELGNVATEILDDAGTVGDEANEGGLLPEHDEFQVSEHGSHCDQYVSMDMHHISTGQQASP